MPAFIESLLHQTIEALTADGSTAVLWGFNPDSAALAFQLGERGFKPAITAIVDDAGVSKTKRLYDGIPVITPEELRAVNFDVLVIALNTDKELALTRFRTYDARLPQVIIAGTDHLRFRDPEFDLLRDSLIVPSRAAGYGSMLIHLYQCLQYIKKRGLQGDIAEFGVYKGGTTAFIAKTIRSLELSARLYAFDTFSGFPARKSVLDLYSDAHDEYRDDGSVAAYLTDLSVTIVPGDISDTYRKIAGVPLSLSFFDTDNYSPTRAALEMCYEQTVSGGVLAFDHYYCDERWLYTVGERIAIDEVLSDKQVFHLHGTGIFIKF